MQKRLGLRARRAQMCVGYPHCTELKKRVFGARQFGAPQLAKMQSYCANIKKICLPYDVFTYPVSRRYAPASDAVERYCCVSTYVFDHER
jgi:hypothetical protein